MEDNVLTLPIVHLASEYLRTRGLQPEEIVRLGGRFCTPTEIISRLGWAGMAAQHYLGGLWLPGRDTMGEESPRYGHAVLWTRPGFGEIAERKRFCPFGANEAVFFPVPERAGGSWATLNPEVPVIICESWIKASVAYLCGFAAVGLNGVDGWSAGSRTMLDSLTGARWRGQRVAVVFDTLSRGNPHSAANVSRATALVQSHMHAAGARVMDIRVAEPPEGMDSWGLDDWVAVVGRSVFAAACGAAREMDEWELNLLSAACADLNGRYAYVRDIDKVVSLENVSVLMGVGHFCNAEAPSQVTVEDRRISVANYWVKKYTERHTVNRLCWRPGFGRLVDGCVNLWNGFTAESVELEGMEEVPDGAAEAAWMWVDTIREVFPDGCDELLDILALMVQRPEMRVGRYIFASGKQGTGKNFIFKPIERLLGRHCVGLNLERYAEKFNMQLSAARMILVSEVEPKINDRVRDRVYAEVKNEADTLESWRSLEPKGAEIVSIERNALLVMLSNYDIPFNVDSEDRRGLILQSNSACAKASPDTPWGTKDNEWWQERWAWANTDRSVRQVRRLLENYPVNMERLAGMPTMTEAKRLVVSGKSETTLRAWASRLVHKPDVEYAHLRFARIRDLCCLRHMGDDKRYEYTRAEGITLGIALAREGCKSIMVKIDGKLERIVMLRGSREDRQEIMDSLEGWKALMNREYTG